MRATYRDIDAAKSIAKRISQVTGASLATCQEVLALVSGYSGWRELVRVRDPEGKEITTFGLDELALFIALIATKLGVGGGDVQYALSTSPALPRAKYGITDHTRLRARVFRYMDIPEPGRRKPGAVGKFKATDEPLILREYGQPVHCISNKGVNALVADHEFVTPRIPLPLFIPARLYLAYGMWTEADGAKVLFSRDYVPLWRLRESGRPERVSPVEWISYTSQEWYWTDASAPWRNEERLRGHVQRLEEFGVRGVPKLVEVLPTMIFRGGPGSLKSIVNSYFDDEGGSAAPPKPPPSSHASM